MNGATFTVKAVDLWRVLGNAAVATSDDQTFPALASIQVTVGEPDDGSGIAESTITAAGTDKYMLLVDEAECIGVTAPITFLLPKGEWARLDKMLKPWRNGGYVVATVEGTDERIRWDMPDGTAIVTVLQDGDYPRWLSLIPAADATVKLDGPIGFAPSFLARFDKCRVDGKPVLRLTCPTATKGARIDMGDTLHGVIMPVRLAG